MTTFTFTVSDLPAPVGVLLRARFYYESGDVIDDLALDEGPAGFFSGEVVADLQEPGVPQYEVRQVAEQTGDSFDSSTVTILSRGDYGSTTVPPDAPVIVGGTRQFNRRTRLRITGPAGATIYYALDGRAPYPPPLAHEYTESSYVYRTTTVKAVAVRDGLASDVVEAVLTRRD